MYYLKLYSNNRFNVYILDYIDLCNMFLKQEKTPIVSKCVSCIDISALLVSIQILQFIKPILQ